MVAQRETGACVELLGAHPLLIVDVVLMGDRAFEFDVFGEGGGSTGGRRMGDTGSRRAILWALVVGGPGAGPRVFVAAGEAIWIVAIVQGHLVPVTGLTTECLSFIRRQVDRSVSLTAP